MSDFTVEHKTKRQGKCTTVIGQRSQRSTNYSPRQVSKQTKLKKREGEPGNLSQSSQSDGIAFSFSKRVEKHQHISDTCYMKSSERGNWFMMVIVHKVLIR